MREIYSITKQLNGKKYCKTSLVRSETGELIAARDDQVENLLSTTKMNH